jgi:amidase
MSPPFDVLTTNATDLRDLLHSGQVTSVEIVELYLAQMEKHNKKELDLNAIFSVAPRETVLSRARELDQGRAVLMVSRGAHCMGSLSLSKMLS